MGLLEDNPALKKALYQLMRSRNWPTLPKNLRNVKSVDYAISERAGWASAFARNAEDGMIALCRSGMDCDCTQYAHTEHMPVPKSLFAFVHGENDHRQWLDGPESTWIAKPSEYPERHASADRALEAYEDGHPSTVYWGDL